MTRKSDHRGVYEIRCRATGRYYIGSSKDIESRWSQHRSLLRRKSHFNKALQSIWDKHGPDNLICSILEVVEDEASLYECEMRWISKRTSNALVNQAGLVRSQPMRIRFSPEDLVILRERMNAYGHPTMASLVRFAIKELKMPS
jgi:group I intron endonuclease